MGPSDAHIKLLRALSRPAEGRQKLLDRFIDVCNELKADPYDVVTASLYVCCVGAHDRMHLTRDTFLDMAATFYDDIVDQRDEDDERKGLKGVFDAGAN